MADPSNTLFGIRDETSPFGPFQERAPSIPEPIETELTTTIEMNGRFFNLPTINRTTGEPMEISEAVAAAKIDGILGAGFGDVAEALRNAQARSDLLGSIHRMGGMAPTSAIPSHNPGGTSPPARLLLILQQGDT